MPKFSEPEIIKKFKAAVINNFNNEAEFNNFLHTPEHWWGSPDKNPGQSRTCYQYLCNSRNKDRLDYAIKTVISLKTTIAFPS